jgi:hypothetical protein
MLVRVGLSQGWTLPWGCQDILGVCHDTIPTSTRRTKGLRVDDLQLAKDALDCCFRSKDVNLLFHIQPHMKI